MLQTQLPDEKMNRIVNRQSALPGLSEPKESTHTSLVGTWPALPIIDMGFWHATNHIWNVNQDSPQTKKKKKLSLEAVNINSCVIGIETQKQKRCTENWSTPWKLDFKNQQSFYFKNINWKDILRVRYACMLFSSKMNVFKCVLDATGQTK